MCNVKNGAGGIFHDIQEFEEISTDFALRSNLLQVDKGMPTIRHGCIHLEDLIVRHLEISHAMVDGFSIRDGWTTFVVTPDLDHKAIWNGVRSLPNALGIVRSGMDHEVLMPAGWSTVEIDVADHLIDSEGLLPEPVFGAAMAPEKGLLHLSALAAFATRRDLLALFDHDAPPATAVLCEDPALALRRRVLDLLATVAEHGCRETTPLTVSSVFQAYRQVRKARALIDAQLRDNPSIEHIARELGMTTRSLHRCFLAVLRISPKQYVMARKLNAARRVLVGGAAASAISPTTTASSVPAGSPSSSNGSSAMRHLPSRGCFRIAFSRLRCTRWAR